jgi:putative oxidoreductase
MDRAAPYLSAFGRLFLSSVFVWAGYEKLMDPGGTAQEFAAAGVPAPSLMVWVAVIVELIGGLAVLVGLKTRWVAALLAIWCLATGFAVHLGIAMAAGDPMAAIDNMIHFYKNLGLAGGFLYVIAFGAGAISFDNGWVASRAAR